MQLLVLKINDIETNPEYALLSKKQSEDKYTPGDWTRVRSLARGKKVLVLLPASEVVLTSTVIPSKNKKQLLQAIPYALEDTLAEDIEDLHFSVHQQGNDNKTNVAIINRSTLSKVLDTLRSHGLTASYILPEVLTQKFEQDTWSVVLQNKEDDISANVRLDQFNGFSCDEGLLGLFLDEALELNPPKRVFTNTTKENLPESLHETAIEHVDSDTINYQSAISALPLNLLNHFVRNNQSSSINWKAWRSVAVLGGILASIWIGIFFWENSELKQQSQQLDSQIKQLYKDTFPNSRIVNASAQMNNELKKLKSNIGTLIESPLPLIANISPLLKEFKDLELSEIRYQDNQLSMTIEATSLTRLENFKKAAAEKSNLFVDIKDSTTTANKVKASIVISPLTSSAAKKGSELNSNKVNT